MCRPNSYLHGPKLVINSLCHQVISLTNVDLSSKVFYGIHLKAFYQEMLMDLFRNMFWKYYHISKGANEQIYFIRKSRKPKVLA